jgi:hypothetical protein
VLQPSVALRYIAEAASWKRRELLLAQAPVRAAGASQLSETEAGEWSVDDVDAYWKGMLLDENLFSR